MRQSAWLSTKISCEISIFPGKILPVFPVDIPPCLEMDWIKISGSFFYGIDALPLHLLKDEGSEPDILHLQGHSFPSVKCELSSTAHQEVMPLTIFLSATWAGPQVFKPGLILSKRFVWTYYTSSSFYNTNHTLKECTFATFCTHFCLFIDGFTKPRLVQQCAR